MQSATGPIPATVTRQTPEADLVALAAAGDGAAFELLMRRHNQLLFRTARSILKNDAEAEDAVQEGYLRAWRALGEFRTESRLSTWLVRIVANEALGRLRRTGAQVIPLEAAMSSPEPETQAAFTDTPQRGPEHSALRSQVRTLLESRIDLLPEACRTVFMLRAVEEMSVEEVAQALDIPEATVRTRFFRARSLLREGLAGEMDGAIGEVFAFDGARCDRIVANVLARARSEGLSGED
ncbi:MAG: RNA polymerase sigma factor [Lautropia sp.]|nr:MAG: RNA polymerase sigma factor [Pseudomonadota bacterium]MBC6958524.1 RNA polymerase sigma factor [Lautropia sp.]MCL4700335.1 RNA polymerase sigma factor [Burkholderiaceae bacterium]MDL1906881.1 RNA polymerase sigma factor [Betaproteobacteria bacterium PRO1]RIK90770.1 MAG: RNA polymerase sigma factor [Burkholderiales bacterium]